MAWIHGLNCFDNHGQTVILLPENVIVLRLDGFLYWYFKWTECVPSKVVRFHITFGDFVPSGIPFDSYNKYFFHSFQVIAENLSGLKEMFKSMDTDNSGTITYEELKAGIPKLGTRLSESEIRQLMEAVIPLVSFSFWSS
ncbi:hypothetical protein EZV62_023123 [Acer yangbiense]|uniref:EF-hand domain-containing protein n=1 Tax=Acer yangbiense TaxID=1000413 RepID=A0A5C7H194_9ROSI|nr:hypothetical protein EZV62_023123 [Acer yangbiense]